jgi:class 3 adenylate cyclase/DNA-binding response OmpR family regulator
MGKRILVVAQQTALRAAVARVLQPAGYTAEIASGEKRARQLIAEGQFEGVIVAAGALNTGGLALIREMQGLVGKLVVLADGPNEVKRFNRSFPDALVCLSRPLDHEKVLAFLDLKVLGNAAIREPETIPRLLRFERRTLDLAGHVFLDADGRELPLTAAEFSLLAAFVQRPGLVLSRTQLRDALGRGGAEPYDRSVDMLVARLRRKIEPDPAKARFIITVPGVGYKFAARIERIEAIAEPTGNIINPRNERIAERRQLTVLACQILGFAALSDLDPEDLQSVIRRIYGTCAEVVARFRGTMVRAIGDSLLVYFGYPEAYENDAESAVRAALDLVRVIGKLETPSPRKLRARIGIATGLMVTGDVSIVVGQEPNAVGEALNTAHHLQSAAPAGSVAIAANTRDLIGHFFDCEQLEPVVVEDGYNPLPAWRVVGESMAIGRFEALHRPGMLKLVGREEELERLCRCWSKARCGVGQVVLLTGEAGIGKSRLVTELEERLRNDSHGTLRYSGSPYQSDVPMSALLDELQRSAGIISEDSAPQRLSKLRALFEGSDPNAIEATAILAELFALPPEAGPSIAQLASQRRKERTFATLLARIECIAAHQPLLVIIEDVQWVDPTSLELLALLVERAARLPILVVVVGRPEFVLPWPDHSYLSAFTVSRLSRADCEALIEQIAGDQPLSTHTKSQILGRADGMPLFVEELTKSVLEIRRERHGRRGLTEPNVVHGIPTTLHASLLARLDRLGRAKETARVGAAIGREFSYELLRVVTTTDEPTLSQRLDKLVASGLVFRRGAPSRATFAFKHALVRDAAYGMLLRAQRQKLHASIARSYEGHFPETIDAQPELLAYHWKEAGSVGKAIGYLLAAAERALLRSATTETRAHLTRHRTWSPRCPRAGNDCSSSSSSRLP